MAGPYRVWVQRICITRQGWEQEQVLVDICNEDKDKYRFGFNGQEKVNEWSGVGNHNTALYWEYSTRTGIRANRDPKRNPSVSPYATFGLNPIRFGDPLGDSIFVNNQGYVSRNDHTDNMVFINWNNKPVKLGEIGKVINVEFIFKNLLEANMKTAKGIYSPWTFKSLVRNRGEWDYKSNMKTIYGLANHTKGLTTKFTFEGEQLEAPDLGNIHFGAVGKAYGFFPEKFMLKQAGEAQMAAGTSKPEWQKYKINLVPAGIHSNKLKEEKEMIAPYGDDPKDQDMIKAGFRFYEAQKKK